MQEFFQVGVFSNQSGLLQNQKSEFGPPPPPSPPGEKIQISNFRGRGGAFDNGGLFENFTPKRTEFSFGISSAVW